MTPKLATLYLGVLLSLAFVLSSLAHADGPSRKRKPVRYYASPHEDTHEWGCLGRVRGVGTQWIGLEGAMDAAKKDWSERVRYDYGEIFIDLTHARDFESRCGRTSIGQVAGQILMRCEVFARPCKAELTKVEGAEIVDLTPPR